MQKLAVCYTRDDQRKSIVSFPDKLSHCDSTGKSLLLGERPDKKLRGRPLGTIREPAVTEVANCSETAFTRSKKSNLFSRK